MTRPRHLTPQLQFLKRQFIKYIAFSSRIRLTDDGLSGHEREQSAVGRHARKTLMKRVAAAPSRSHRRLCRVDATRICVRAWTKSYTKSLKDHMKFLSKAMVDPEIEDTIEKAIGGRQPHSDKLYPLWDATA